MTYLKNAFQPWHSAVEFKRYLHRFMKEFTRIETLAGVKRTIFNQYDALVRPLESWLAKQGVRFLKACTVTNLDLTDVDGKLAVTGLTYQSNGKPTVVAIDSVDLVFLQNASMTDASSSGSMTRAPEPLTKSHSGGWQLWEKLAKDHPEFGNPAAFNSSIPESYWESFTVTFNDPVFFEKNGGVFWQSAWNRRTRHIQGLPLAHVDRATASAALRRSAGGCSSVLGLCAASRPDW